MSKATKTGNEVLVGSDANSHHIARDSSNTNKRGQALLDSLNTNDLIAFNNGSKATFVNKIWEEILYIYLC